jgi:hypothetical protein
MSEPSIKGSTFQGVIDDLHQAITQGQISLEDAEARLGSAELPFLDREAKANPASWYSIESYRRIVELLLDVVGGGDDAYLIERGAKSAVRLRDAGVYQQVEYVGRINESRRNTQDTLVELQRQLRLIVTLARSIYNFGEWDVEVEGDLLRVVVTDARSLPNIAVLTIVGFMNKMGEFADSPTPARWRGDRVTLNRVEFTMLSSVDEV